MQKQVKKILTGALAIALSVSLMGNSNLAVLAETESSVESEVSTETQAETEMYSEEESTTTESAAESTEESSEEGTVGTDTGTETSAETTEIATETVTENEAENVTETETESEIETKTEIETETETERETDGFNPDEGNTLSVAVNENVTVTAEIPAGAFDMPVDMAVEVIDVYSDEMAGQAMGKISEMIGQEQKAIVGAYMADISFINEEGEEVEPAETVVVTVTTAPVDMGIPSDANANALDAAVYHVVDGGITELEKGAIELDDDYKFIGMSFASGSFSPFVGVLMTKPMMLANTYTYYVGYPDKENNFVTIQDAIDAIAGAQNGTIEGKDASDKYYVYVNEGTYKRFHVPHGVENITIQGKGENTVIQTFVEGDDLASLPKKNTGASHMSDGEGIIIWGADITLSNMKITSGTATGSNWFASVVGTQDGARGPAEEQDTAVILENCIFEGSGVGYAFMPQRSKFTVNGCTISNYDHAIYFAGDGFETQDCNITNNKIEGCVFAIHGYYGGTKKLDHVQPMVISGNTISGTSNRYSVIAIIGRG